jgi:hypothetical protein
MFCRVQNSINEEQKKEIQILQRRLGNLRQEFQDQVSGTAMHQQLWLWIANGLFRIRILPDSLFWIRIWIWIQLQIRPES